MARIFLQNDNLVTVDELRNAADGGYLNAATVTAQLLDSAGGAVGVPITLGYVEDSDGRYQGTLEDDLALSAGGSYTLAVDVDAGSDRIAHWEVPVRVLVRT